MDSVSVDIAGTVGLDLRTDICQIPVSPIGSGGEVF